MFIACQQEERKPQNEPRLSDSSSPQTRQEETQIREENSAGQYSLPELDTIPTVPLALDVFRSNGELFLLDSLSLEMSQLTFTEGTIDTFFLSTARRYVACLKVIEIVDSPGEWEPDVDPPDERIHSILIIDIPERRIVREIRPSDWNQHFQSWISKSRFHFISVGGFDVSGFYVYDIIRDSVQHLPYGATE